MQKTISLALIKNIGSIFHQQTFSNTQAMLKKIPITKLSFIHTSIFHKSYENEEEHLKNYVNYFNKNLKSSDTAAHTDIDSNKEEQKLELEYVSSQFSHFDNVTNDPKQVDISEKPANKKTRIACASGYIQLNEVTFKALVANRLKKGNALIVAEIAGIQASKQTANLIPLCHQILLDVCDVSFECNEATFRVHCKAVCKTSLSKTGVEMEALSACSMALLTIYDMCKAVQKDAVINDIKLDYKYGGKSDFKRV